ncbi:MAG TPA: hypothetical protein G4N97_08315 [Thermoflexia bacterium]|nr:hypothetical protein [Thermoflexia bacterium]
MPVTVVFTGLACGMLLTAVGLALWGGFRQVPRLSHAVQAIGWLAGVTLLIGVLLTWQENHNASIPAIRLMLMAALAALPNPHRRCASSWDSAIPILPALILAGVGLFWSPESVGTGLGHRPVAPMELAIVICGGIGARAMGEALSEIATLAPHVEWSFTAAYMLLTLLVGEMALVNLRQWGTLWGGASGESGMTGAWLIWSAAWLAPRQHVRLRAALTIVATLLLIVLATGR